MKYYYLLWILRDSHNHCYCCYSKCCCCCYYCYCYCCCCIFWHVLTFLALRHTKSCFSVWSLLSTPPGLEVRNNKKIISSPATTIQTNFQKFEGNSKSIFTQTFVGSCNSWETPRRRFQRQKLTMVNTQTFHLHNESDFIFLTFVLDFCWLKNYFWKTCPRAFNLIPNDQSTLRTGTRFPNCQNYHFLCIPKAQ